jgi:hypothetical protein
VKKKSTKNEKMWREEHNNLIKTLSLRVVIYVVLAFQQVILDTDEEEAADLKLKSRCRMAPDVAGPV